MKNNVCMYSGKPIGSRDAVLVENAVNYLRKLGHIVSNKAFLFFLLIPLFLMSFSMVSALDDKTWYPNSTINASLGNPGNYLSPSVFYKDSSWYLVSGQNNGQFYGFAWNGNQWVSNTTITEGLGDIGDHSKPTVFYKDSSWYLISGAFDGQFYGFTWNGTQWLPNSTINSSLGDVGDFSKPIVFYKDSSWYMISGESSSDVWNGFAWNGNQWVSNTTIVTSLPAIGSYISPSVFQKDGIWYIIAGTNLGLFYGFAWDGNQWVGNTIINASLPDLGSRNNPFVFYKDSSWYLIVGLTTGGFSGFSYYESPPPDDSIPPYFITIPNNESIVYGNYWNGVTFEADDETAFDTYAVNDSRFTINDTGFLNMTNLLAVGTYDLNITINDTLNNINWTIYRLTVSKSGVVCDVLFNATSGIVYPAYFRVFTDCSSDYKLYRSGSEIGNNTEINSGAGIYSFSVNRTDTQNYSNIEDYAYFTISKASSLVYAYVNNVRANFQGSGTGFVDFNGTLITGVGNIEMYYCGSLILNDTSPLYYNQSFVPGSCVFQIYNDGNQNYTATAEQWTITISEPPNISWFIIDLESKTTILVLAVFFIVALLLIFLFKMPLFGGGLLVLLGFILLFSSFNIILSFVVIVGGVLAFFLK